MSLINCNDLKLGYDGKVVIEDVSFQVNTGDYLCIVGENGSGKTTLMKSILGLIDTMGGKITFSDDLHPNEIGYLPQQTVVQKDFPASVREIVMSGFLNKTGFSPFYSKEQKAKAAEIMDQLSITNLKNRCYRELSGGQQQRVLLARALCATSKLLLLDEPVAGLDPLVTEEMYSLIKSINADKKLGITIIMVSHDIAAAVKYASYILHVNKRPLFFGKTSEYVKTDIGLAFTKIGAYKNG